MTFTEAAILILRAEGKPLTWRKLAELAVRHDLLSLVGTDPADTMRVRLADVLRRQGEAAPFVEEGGLVTEPDTICILEVMKLMSSIPAGVRGRVARICVENATLVEYGQPLVLIEPEENMARA